MVSSLLDRLFGSGRAGALVRKASFTPRLEGLGERLVPSVTFTENTGTHVLTVHAAAGQNNSVAVVNDGDGGLTVTADGTTRNFTGITAVQVKTYDGADTVTYTQGTSGAERDLVRNFSLDVFLGDNASGTDRFTANIYGDVGYYSDGWRARNLDLMVLGEGGTDRIDVNAATDTDVRAGSAFNLLLYGGGGNDNITFDLDGDVDGVVAFTAAGENDNDAVAVNLHLDVGSSGRVQGVGGGSALVRGDLGDDVLTFAVRVDAGATAGVDAVIDGGFGWGWPDDDTGYRTANVRSAYLEHDFVIQ